MSTGYYPGCSLEGTAEEFNMAVRETARALDIELKEIDDWNCCGASAAHQTNHTLSLALPGRGDRDSRSQVLGAPPSRRRGWGTTIRSTGVMAFVYPARQEPRPPGFAVSQWRSRGAPRSPNAGAAIGTENPLGARTIIREAACQEPRPPGLMPGVWSCRMTGDPLTRHRG